MLVMSLLLRWPDWSIPDRFATGFNVCSINDGSNIYTPPKRADEQVSLVQLLEEADAWNSDLAADTKAHDTDKEILSSTLEEIEKGILSQPLRKDQLDAVFGRGHWKAIRRRAIWQAGKDLIKQ